MIAEKILPFVALILTPVFAEYFEECSTVAADSFVAVEDDCRSFMHCTDEGTSLKYTCPEGTYFGEESGKCELDFDNICSSAEDDSEQSTEIDKEETTEKTTASIIVPEHINHIIKPKCDRHKNGKYPHIKRCEYYYKCVAGYLTILRCNFYHAWDYKKEMCLPYNVVKCIDGSRLTSYKPKVLGTVFSF